MVKFFWVPHPRLKACSQNKHNEWEVPATPAGCMVIPQAKSGKLSTTKHHSNTCKPLPEQLRPRCYRQWTLFLNDSSYHATASAACSFQNSHDRWWLPQYLTYSIREIAGTNCSCHIPSKIHWSCKLYFVGITCYVEFWNHWCTPFRTRNT